MGDYAHPTHCKIIGFEWLFKVKFGSNGSPVKYKACFIAKGYAQCEGEDFDKTFAPIACYSTIQIFSPLH